MPTAFMAAMRFLIPMMIGQYGAKVGTQLLRKMVTGGAGSVTEKLASGAASKLAGNAVGRMADKGLGQVAGQLPAWAASRMGVEPIARAGVGLAGEAAKTALFAGGMMAGEVSLEALFGRGSEKTIDGWEQFQGQPNPSQQENASSLAAIQDHSEMKHLERALKEAIAARNEEQAKFGGLY